MLGLNPCQYTQEDQDLSVSEAVITPTGEHRRIVSVTAGLFVLKTGSVDSLIAKATKFLLVISRLLALCNMRQVGWVEQDGPAVAADKFPGKRIIDTSVPFANRLSLVLLCKELLYHLL